MAVKLTTTGKNKLNEQNKIASYLVQCISAPEKEIKLAITNYHQQRQRERYIELSSILHRIYNISQDIFCECPIIYLQRNCALISENSLKLIDPHLRYTIEQAKHIFEQWKIEPHFTGPNEHKLRCYLWLQILDIITHETMRLRPVKLNPEEEWCLELGLALPSNKTKLAQFHHSYRPIVSNDEKLFNLVTKFIDAQDQNLINQIPLKMLSLDPKEPVYFYIERAEEYKPQRAKKQKFFHPQYLICSNCEQLYHYFIQELEKIISPHAWAQQHDLALHREDKIKILNLDTHRMCIRPGKDYLIDESRRIASKDKARLQYYATLINAPVPFTTTPKVSAVAKKNKLPRPRKQTIPVDIRLKVWEKYNPALQGQCFVCRDALHYRNHHSGHIQAEAKGGEVSLTNLVPICQQCNLVMGTTHLLDFVTHGRLEYLKNNPPLIELMRKYRPEVDISTIDIEPSSVKDKSTTTSSFDLHSVD